MPTTILIAEDEFIIRLTIAEFLRDEGYDVIETANADEALDVLKAGIPVSLVFTDVRMPDMSGVDLARRLKELGVPDPVIVITGHADVPLAVEAMKAGVADFIEKPFDDEVILSAIRTALERGGKDIEGAAERARIAERIAALSGREHEVLEGLVAGHANKVIAYDLGISARTVEVYRANVMTKMGASSLSELVRMALIVGKT